MFKKKTFIYTLALTFVFLFAILVIAQSGTLAPTEQRIATDLRYLETYNINQLNHDPLWHTATQPEALFPHTLYVQQDLAYLTTYNIAGLEDDPLWQSSGETFTMAQADNR